MEISRPVDFSLEEETLLDMHSVLNVMNVVIFEIMRLGEHMGGPDELSALQDQTVDAADRLRDPDAAEQQVVHVEDFIDRVNRVLDTVAGADTTDPAVREIRTNLESIFAILRVRAREIVARHRDPRAWVTHDIPQLRTNFTQVFQAIEQNSHGRYRIVYNVAEHEAGNYLVNFEITSAAGATIDMPAVFQDVMRDLLANARKYTAPGGRIEAGLYNSGSELRYVVSDTGIGIPDAEITAITDFGVRGSNVKDRPTRGGGFGLTKAYYVTRRFGGRMWIDSSPAGTRIEIRIPCPGV